MGPGQLPARGRDLLIVDDDPLQVHMFRYLLEELGCTHRCHSAATGMEALEFLRRQGANSNAPRPELILLDINMPGMSGCEVLVEIKRDPELRSIPVIMFSSSLDFKEVAHCYSERANAYVKKPMDYRATVKIIQEIEHFWLQTVSLPAGGSVDSAVR